MSKIIRNAKISLLAVVLFASSVATLVLPGNAIAISGQTIASLTNIERSNNGLPNLAWNAALANSAWQKAEDMCTKSYWAHTAPDGTTGWTFMNQSGYKYTAAGENLAMGFDSDTGIVAGWMASPGHRANILNTSYNDIGVGSASCMFQGTATTFVVAHYGATAASTAARQRAVSAPTSTAVKSVNPEPAPSKATAASPPAEVKPAKTEPNFGINLGNLSWNHYPELINELLNLSFSRSRTTICLPPVIKPFSCNLFMQ